MRIAQIIIALALLLMAAATAAAFPLDGGERTGITRLDGFRLAQQGTVRGRKLPKGALLDMAQVDLRLTDRPELEPGEPDPEFTEQVVKLLGAEADRYNLAVLDLTDPNRPAYALHRADARRNPGSVGKLLVALGVFQALADIYPDNLKARERVLRETMVRAGGIITYDSHVVPFWDPAKQRLYYRPLRQDDQANLWSFLDWMLSASSNAAASVVVRELLLLSHFGRDYPVPEETSAAFLRDTSRQELSQLLTTALIEPVRRNGLDPEQLRQGGFFTKAGKRLARASNSTATARQLLRFLLRLEQGRLVDPFSCRELKRLIYMTQKRIRYASAPALAGAAVYFKSGSFYKCQPEPGFVCRKYHGNVYNLMHSVAIVEAPAGTPKLFYLVVVMSDVLRVNSAVAHQTLATRLHRLLEARQREREGKKPDAKRDAKSIPAEGN